MFFDLSRAETGTYTFLGDCYVHGLMQGEFITKMEKKSLDTGAESAVQSG